MALTFGTLLSSQGSNAHRDQSRDRPRGNSPNLAGPSSGCQTSERSPAEGAHGLTFAYRVLRQPLLSQSVGFHRGLANPIDVRPSRPTWYAVDNGFAAVEASARAHRPIVEIACAALSGRGGAVLDLGCGNGALLQQIHGRNMAIVPFGIDAVPDRVEHARTLLPQFADHFITGDMFDRNEMWPPDRRYALALLMPGRLLEVGADRAKTLLARLKVHCDQLLVYAYGDWLSRFGGLQGLARKAELSLTDTRPGATAALARVA